jgi:hypothetical protein
MSLHKIKHNIIEIEGIRCIEVENNISPDRADFLTKLLSHNGYQVKVEPIESNYTIGVTDLLFNPVIDVYKRRLKSLTGKKVTPSYWMQQSTSETEHEVNYWDTKK